MYSVLTLLLVNKYVLKFWLRFQNLEEKHGKAQYFSQESEKHISLYILKKNRRRAEAGSAPIESNETVLATGIHFV